MAWPEFFHATAVKGFVPTNHLPAMKLAPLLLALLALSATAATLYRWTDAQGNVHYTDQPPPADAKNVMQKDYRGSKPEDDVSPAMAQAASKYPVTLYITQNCGVPCEQGKLHLGRRGIPFATKDPAASKEDYLALNPDGGEIRVPTLTVGDEKLIGYSETAWDAALDKAGYPKAAPAGNKP
jgi:hypothetical protein